MSDNRKYYYLKLKENYFDDDSIVLLESMQDGVLYSNILLKLYLKSLKHGGRLQLDEDIPYTAQMIATITRQQIGTVERALQIFLKLGLVEVLDSGTFYMRDLNLLNQAWPNAVFGLRPRLFFLLIPYIHIFVLHRRLYERKRPYHLRASDLRGNGTDPGDDSVHPHALRCLPL